MPAPQVSSAGVRCEADVIEGIETFAADEIAMLGGRVLDAGHGHVWFEFAQPFARLLTLKSVLAVYTVAHFAVPRPKALLGDANLRAVLQLVDGVLGGLPRSTYRTFMLGAAGADSAVMQRIRQTIAAHTKLDEADEEGDLLVRIRPAGGGWDVLARIGPKPLSTRAWRACVMEGALQATVAHVMALLSRPKAHDVYLNLGCGTATLLIERSLCGAAKKLIGCDIDTQTLACATRNVKASGQHIELNTWDATALPLPDSSVSALTADLPFGVRVGSHSDNERLYPALLREAARVAKPKAHFVVISAEVRLLQQTVEAQSVWAVEQTFRVNLGGLKPVVAVLRRA